MLVRTTDPIATGAVKSTCRVHVIAIPPSVIRSCPQNCPLLLSLAYVCVFPCVVAVAVHVLVKASLPNIGELNSNIKKLLNFELYEILVSRYTFDL